MGFFCYWAAVVRLAFRHSLDLTQYVIFGLLVVGGILGWLLPFPAMIFHLLGLDVDVTGWQFGTVALGSIIAIRLALAPYWMYRDKPSRPATDLLERQIAAQEDHTAELRRQREQRERENDPMHRAFAAIRERDNRILLGLEPLEPLEILYDPNDSEGRFIWQEMSSINRKPAKTVGFNIGIRNNTKDRSISKVLVFAEGDAIISHFDELNRLGEFELHPGATQFARLFTIQVSEDDSVGALVGPLWRADHPFLKINKFTLRARGKDAKEVAARFEYDPNQTPMIRRLD
jgi:hypothetical protein